MEKLRALHQAIASGFDASARVRALCMLVFVAVFWGGGWILGVLLPAWFMPPAIVAWAIALAWAFGWLVVPDPAVDL